MGDNQDRRGSWQNISQHWPGPLINRLTKYIRPYLPDVSFITLHYLYFIVACMITSLIFWGSSTPSQSIEYTDCLFFAISAMTEAGLNTVNLSTLNTWQQVMLFLLIMMGSAIFVSSAILHIRKRAFERRFYDLAKRKSKMHLSESFTFSRSKRKASTDRREAAIASGALRGTAIKDDRDESDADVAVEDADEQHSHLPDRRLTMDTAALPPPTDNVNLPDQGNAHIKFIDHARSPTGDSTNLTRVRRTQSRLFTGSGVGVRGMERHPRNAVPMYREDDQHRSDQEKMDTRFGSVAKIDRWIEEKGGFIGRNSQFHNLSEKDRKRLGGIEYDAVCLLSWVVPTYFILWQLFGAIGMGAWLQINRPDVALANGLNPFWTGAFFAISAFNNSGMALLDANAVALQTSYYALLTLGLLILAGNTAFPPFLRLVLWTMKKCVPKSAQSPEWQTRRRTLDFILTHPRRVYTNLFPAAQTWWLVGSLVLLNGIDWIAFEILNIGNPVTEAIPPHFRVLDGLFQAFAVRSGGFYVVGIASLYPGLLVLYVLMMYVSALPVTMTIRNTNVYEERSLGIFSEDQPQQDEEQRRQQREGMLGTIKRVLTSKSGVIRSRTLDAGPVSSSSWSRQDFIRQQLRGQLGHDLWWLALAVLFITIIETSQFNRNPVVFSVFNIIFEVTSAYGCVGISTGVPWNAYSFCGAWHKGSKLILCAVMLRGRHRGLPVAIDKAVLLPDETLAWAEEEDGRRREKGRSMSISRDLGGLSRRGTGLSSGLDAGVGEGEGNRLGVKEERGKDREKDAANIV